MKIVIFSPVNKKSAIAYSVNLVIPELGLLGLEVIVVSTDLDFPEGEHLIDERKCILHKWQESYIVDHCCKDADVLIYTIGDNYLYHAGALQWMERYPGVVCLHDFFLCHLFYGYYNDQKDEGREVLTHIYDDKIANDFFNFSNSNDFIHVHMQKAPLTEWICSKALAVITHSSWQINRVLNSCLGPVRVEALPYDAKKSAPIPKDTYIDKKFGKINVLSFGHMNENKRMASIIEAMGRSEEVKKNYVYHLVGQIVDSTKNKLLNLAKEYSVEIKIWGQVDDLMLSSILNEVDLVCCLRYPALEASSASLIESLLMGKPTIVTKTGSYEEIPDDCVIKVAIENEVEELTSIFLDFIANQMGHMKMAQIGQAWAKETYSPKRYAESILEIIEDLKVTEVVKQALNQMQSIHNVWSCDSTFNLSEEDIKRIEIFELSSFELL